MGYVTFWIYGPAGKIFRSAVQPGTVTRTGDTVTGLSNITVNGATWPAGDYRVDFVQLGDAANNTADTRYDGGPALSSRTFRVAGTDADGTAPRQPGTPSRRAARLRPGWRRG